MFAYRFRQRAVPHLAIEHRLEFGVPSGNRIADDHHIDLAGDVIGAVPSERSNPLRLEERAHRRIDVLVRPLHVVPLSLQQRSQSGHRCPAHTDEMNRHSTAASSIINRGLPLAMRRAWTPNGSVTSGPDVWPDGKPYTTGPVEFLEQSASTARADGSPPGSSQSGISPSTNADAESRTPGQPQLRQHAIEPVRAL